MKPKNFPARVMTRRIKALELKEKALAWRLSTPGLQGSVESLEIDIANSKRGISQVDLRSKRTKKNRGIAQ